MLTYTFIYSKLAELSLFSALMIVVNYKLRDFFYSSNLEKECVN